MTSKAVTKPAESGVETYVALHSDQNIAEVLADNLDGAQLTLNDLPSITVPPGGGTYWTLPDGQEEKIFEGVVVFSQQIRSYWLKEPDGSQTTPPDCSSIDAILGTGLYGTGSELHPSGICDNCPMAGWGSDPRGGRGQACRLRRLVYVVRQSDYLPAVLSVPTDSLQNWKQYAITLANQGVRYSGVVTRFAIEKIERGAQSYGRVMFAPGSKLTPEQAAVFRQIGEAVKSVSQLGLRG